MIHINQKEFEELTNYMKLHYGINLTQKRMLIEGRLNNILVEKGFTNFEQYLHYVLNDKTGREIATLINKLTTNHTFFMREVSHFSYYKDIVLPNISSKAMEKDLRVWSAGCSTGEEPYTLAMINSDFFSKNESWDTKILATDISTRALEIAEKGVYPSETIQQIPKLWQLNNFIKIDKENSQIVDKIRKEIIFRAFNLMTDVFPFKKKFHVIFCRNVMIYFDQDTKMKLIKKFYDATEEGGYLFIGHSESINREESEYNYIMPAVYQKG